MNKFKNTSEAFDFYLKAIRDDGIDFGETKTLFNVGFLIEEPLDNVIKNNERKFSVKYASREWDWYLSGDRSAKDISKFAPIWLNHMDENGYVNSNYGWQWSRNGQLAKIVEQLRSIKDTRQAVVSIYDGKEIDQYKHDTPCTLSVHFQYYNNALNITVNMRSNDLWFGFCNDQFQFSNLLSMVASELGVKVGTYYHFASNLHLYKKHLI
tara:strand:- start:1039 stop:1668 length:630 start_codon:yes stop_codon:yes gene_type:complete